MTNGNIIKLPTGLFDEIVGHAGSSKSYQFRDSKKLYVTYENVLARRNADDLNLTGITVHRLLGIDIYGNQIRSGIIPEHGLIIDELLKLSPNIFSMLIKHIIQNEIPTTFIYSKQQLLSRDTCENNIFTDSDFYTELIGNKSIEKLIEKGRCRYTDETVDVLFGKKHHIFPEINPDLEINLCFTNRTRIKINWRFYKKLGGSEKLPDFTVADWQNIPEPPLIIGSRIINNKTKDISICTDASIKGYSLYYAQTIHSSQGSTIREPFNLFELNHYFSNDRLRYTGFTRTSDINFIHTNSR